MSGTTHIDGKWHDRAHCALKIVGAALLAALVLGLAEIRSKHALGLMSALTATAMLLRFALARAWR